ncbi:MAG: hypothetical protein HYY00_06000 [Chloroflexi bacterium]|nr:hypothetical protein [Chloroflexota bacterium]
MRERIELAHLHKTGRYSVAELAAAFGVSRKTKLDPIRSARYHIIGILALRDALE